MVFICRHAEPARFELLLPDNEDVKGLVELRSPSARFVGAFGNRFRLQSWPERAEKLRFE